jgi:hypothetical protein
MSDQDHRRRVAERNEARQGNIGTMWRSHFQNPRNFKTWKTHNSDKTTDQTQEEVLHLGEEKGEKDPRNSQTITEVIHTLLSISWKRYVRHGYPLVPTDQGPRGPCQVGPTCKWAQRPYPEPRRPWKTLDDLIRTLEDLPGLWRKLLLRLRWRHRQ